MNNSTVPEAIFDCGYSKSYWDAARMMTYITYTIVPPICFVIGMPGHILALIAFLKHRNEETAYSYQILNTWSRILEILFMTLFAAMFYHGAGQDWSGARSGDGPDWFVTNHALMRFTCHFVPMLAEAFVGVAVFTSAATSADRVFALWKPFVYQSINYKKHFILASLACFFVPLASSANMSLNFELIWKNEKYYIQYSEFSRSPYNNFMSQMSSSIRSLAQFALILCSVIMVCLFKKRNKKVQNMVIKDEKKEAKRKLAERTLFVLTLFQSVATTVPSLLITVWEIGMYFSHTFGICQGSILSPFTDLLLEIVNASDFYVILLVNKSFWRMVIATLRPPAPVTVASVIVDQPNQNKITHINVKSSSTSVM